MNATLPQTPRGVMGLNGYQWTVLFAAWLGWGFDVFDGLLFNYVAPNCVPTLLHIPLGSPEAKAAYQYWTGILTAVLLLSWAVGGMIFGRIADKIGRTKTLLLTMLLFAVGTACSRPGPEYRCPDPLPHRGGSGHRRRMGGGRVDGGRSRSRKTPGGGGRSALYIRARRPVSGDVCRPPDFQSLVPGQPRTLLALRLPLRPASRRRRVSWCVSLFANRNAGKASPKPPPPRACENCSCRRTAP